MIIILIKLSLRRCSCCREVITFNEKYKLIYEESLIRTEETDITLILKWFDCLNHFLKPKDAEPSQKLINHHQNKDPCDAWLYDEATISFIRGRVWKLKSSQCRRKSAVRQQKLSLMICLNLLKLQHLTAQNQR